MAQIGKRTKAARVAFEGKELVTVEEAGRMLRLPRSTIYRQLSERGGWLPSVRIGRHVRISRPLLLAAIREQAQTPRRPS